MRGRGVGRAAAALGLGLVAVAMVDPGSAAGALEPVRSGWWSELSAAPAPPDVPADGLHVAGGPSGPSAIAAMVFELPVGAAAKTVTVTLAGASPMAGGLQACLVPLDAAGFEPAQNGAWDDRPAYDCALGAAPVELDGVSATFAVGALQQDHVLAVALVPGETDRASIERPTSDSLQFAAAPTPPTTAATVSDHPAPAQEQVATAPVATTPRPASFALPPPSPVLEFRSIDAASAGVVDVPRVTPAAITSPIAERVEESWRTRTGGALGFALLLAALLFYSQGRGLLGARVGGT